MPRNPVLTKELRSVMRKKRAFAIAMLYVLVLGAFVIYAWPKESEALWGSKIGQNIFRRFSVAQFFLISILAPALTAGSLTAEKEQNTLGMLFSTALRPRQILSGKLLSPLLYCSLLICASIPVTSLCFVLGGVSPEEVILVYVVCAVAALFYGSIGLLASVGFRKTLFSMPAAYLLIIAINVVTWRFSLVAQFLSYQCDISPERSSWSLDSIKFQSSERILLNLGLTLAIALLLLRLLKRGYEPVEGRQSEKVRKWEGEKPVLERSEGVVKQEKTAGAGALQEQADEAVDSGRESRSIRDRQNPLLAKELRTRMFGKKVWFIRAVYASVIFSQCFLIFLTFNVSTFVNATNTIFCAYAMIHISIVILFSGLITACSITLEREQQTLGLLINTLLKPRQIVFGKLLGAFWYIAMMIVGSFPPTILAVFGTIISFETAACFIIAQIVYAYSFGVVGLLCSLKCRRTVTAIGCTAGIIFALSTPSFLLSAVKRTDRVFQSDRANRVARAISPIHTTANIVTREVSDSAAGADVIRSIVGAPRLSSPYLIPHGYMVGGVLSEIGPFAFSIAAYALLATTLLCLTIRLFPILCRAVSHSSQLGITRAAVILIFALFSSGITFWPARAAHCQTQEKATPAKPRTIEGLSWQVHAGYDGSFKIKCYAPIVVSIENAGETFDGEIILELKRVKRKASRYRKSVHLPAPSKRIYTLYARFDLSFEKAAIELRSSDGALIGDRRELKLEPIFGGNLAIVLSESPIALDLEHERMMFLKLKSRNVCLEPSHLPDEWTGYDAVDLVIIGDIDPGTIGNVKVKALKEWTAAGGKLMFMMTGNWQSVRGTWLEEILPVEIMGRIPVRSLPSLSKKFKTPADTRPEDLGGEGIVIGGAKVVGGEAMIEQDGVPILAKRRFGFGMVYYLGFSLDEREIRSWRGISELWRLIYEDRTLRPIIGGAGDERAIAEILVDVPSLDLPPRWMIGSFIAAFALLLGPVNYLFLMRRRRFPFAWITMPVIIVCATAAAYLYGRRIKGEDVLLNEISLAETSTDCEIARVTHYSGLFAPRGGVFDLIVNDASATISPLLSNQPGARPGRQARNVRRQKGTSPASKTSTIKGIKVDSSALADKLDHGGGDSVVLRDIEIQYATMRHFQSTSRRNLGGAIKAELRRLSGSVMLKGEITNDTSLDVKDCFLLDRGARWYLGDITQGTRKVINLSRNNRKSGPLRVQQTTVNQKDAETARQQAIIARESRRKSDLLKLLRTAEQAARAGGLGRRFVPPATRSQPKNDEVILGGWVAHPLLDMEVAGGNFDRSSLSLFLCHIPVTRDEE